MPDLRTTAEDPIQIHDDLDFVEKQNVTSGEASTPAYTISGERNYVIGIERNTPIALEFYDTNGDPVDDSARATLQKTDPQENPLGNAIAFEANMGQFDYSKMRADPEFFKTTTKSIILDEREFVHLYLDLPSNATEFDASQSRISVGDPVTQTGKPVFVRRRNTLSPQGESAMNQASSNGGA